MGGGSSGAGGAGVVVGAGGVEGEDKEALFSLVVVSEST